MSIEEDSNDDEDIFNVAISQCTEELYQRQRPSLAGGRAASPT